MALGGWRIRIVVVGDFGDIGRILLGILGLSELFAKDFWGFRSLRLC